MLKKKIICILLVIILILGTSIVSLAADNEEISQENALETNEINELNEQKNELDEKLEEANSKLEYVQGEMSTALLEIQKLSDKIIAYENENQDLAKQLSILETSITETTTLLEEITTEYTEKDQLLRERLVTVYEEGELSYLDVLLSSNSLSEMLSRYYIMQEMAEYDNQLIDEVARQKEIIGTSKEKLENENAQVKILKAKAEQNEIILKNTKTMHEGYLEQLSDEEKKLNDEIDEYKVEYARIQSKLQEISSDITDIQIQYTGRGNAMASSYC